jgi:NAD(P)H-hydrate epimerase
MMLLTAKEMRLLDRATIDGGHAPGELLMERAGAGVAEAMERRYGATLGLRVLVLCGTGNNGGDGFVAARYLRHRGAEVHVGVIGETEKIQGDALAQLHRLGEDGGRARSRSGPRKSCSSSSAGTTSGTLRSMRCSEPARTGRRATSSPGQYRLCASSTRQARAVIALDLPTGVDADSGAIARRAVRADLTVTFGAPKRGHFLYPARAFVGALEVVDIGLSRTAVTPSAFPVELATAPDMANLLPTRHPRAHKGDVGHVLLVGGSRGLTGAITLAARAATRTGAGYVHVAVPESLLDVIEAKLTEPVKLGMPETSEQSLSTLAIAPLRERLESVGVLGIGCGLSRHPESAELARKLVTEARCPVVLDADGLNAFAGRASELEGAAGPRVLTPHLGEMERLTGVSAAELEEKRIDLAREWAQRWRAVVVLKGAPTVTAAPDGRATVNPTGNPGMATLGMGDVLTGAIAALIAQGLTPYDAARLGVYAHGMAGDLAEGEKGQLGLIASDVLEALPLALLGLTRVRAESLG